MEHPGRIARGVARWTRARRCLPTRRHGPGSATNGPRERLELPWVRIEKD